MNQDWIKLPEFRRDGKGRKIYKAQCLKCKNFFSNHRYMPKHTKACKGNNNFQIQIINTGFLPQVQNGKIDFPKFYEDIINLFCAANISFSQINSPIFRQLFINMGIDDKEIPNSENFRDLIFELSNIKHSENIELFQNKLVSLVIDGTTSWNKSLYQISIYYPGLLRHLTLIQIDKPTANNLKIVINSICEELSKNNISVVGVTTDNASNLVKCFNDIQKEVFEQDKKFPIIRFACAAHTCQLLIEDLRKLNETFNNSIIIISEFISWIRRKKILIESKSQGLKNSPPKLNRTRWNSLYICVNYILKNVDFFKGTIEKFSKTNEKCPIQLNEKEVKQLTAVSNVLKPIIDFTNSVQGNFVSVGSVFCEILKLLNSITCIDDPYGFGFAKIITDRISIRFSQNCDYIIAELGFLFTRSGREWWQMKTIRADAISFKIVQNEEISNEDLNFIQCYNFEKQLLINKIEEMAAYLHINSQNAVKAFLSWLKLKDAFLEEPISYWKTNITAFISFNNEQIKLQDLCTIAVRVLVLPGSEAICERCFSQLKLIHNHLRTTLKSDILDCLLRIKLNLIWEHELTEIDSIIGELSEEEEEEEDFDNDIEDER